MTEKIENETIEDDDIDKASPIYSISSYGADYVVTDLVNRIKNGDIYVPKFQRQFVWRKDHKDSRFIESLLIGLPVPGIFLSKEQETKKLLVIDGQQRLRTLQYFYRGKYDDGTEFSLKKVQERFEGYTYKDLLETDRRQLDDSILHVTIVRQDEPPQDDSSIYQIFERLNTGGNLLRPQEIRACIYHGELNSLLAKLNEENKQWRSLYGKNKVTEDDRLKDQELILRFFALYFKEENYDAPMKEFLNTYMSENRDCKELSTEQLTQLFNKTILNCVELGKKAFKPKRLLNAAVFDAVMIGIAHRLEKGNIQDQENLLEKYQMLLQNLEFIKATQEGSTASKENVRTRIKLAKEAFTDVK